MQTKSVSIRTIRLRLVFRLRVIRQITRPFIHMQGTGENGGTQVGCQPTSADPALYHRRVVHSGPGPLSL
jgi:hypothetical protein